MRTIRLVRHGRDRNHSYRLGRVAGKCDCSQLVSTTSILLKGSWLTIGGMNRLFPRLPLFAGVLITAADVLIVLVFFNSDSGRRGMLFFEIVIVSLVSLAGGFAQGAELISHRSWRSSSASWYCYTLSNRTGRRCSWGCYLRR
jgi:hypothetical protein